MKLANILETKYYGDHPLVAEIKNYAEHNTMHTFKTKDLLPDTIIKILTNAFGRPFYDQPETDDAYNEIRWRVNDVWCLMYIFGTMHRPNKSLLKRSNLHLDLCPEA